MKAAKKFKVRITGSQVVRYDQYVEMYKAEWDKLKKLDGKSFIVHAEGWVDPTDVNDAEDFESLTFERLDTNSKVIETIGD